MQFFIYVFLYTILKFYHDRLKPSHLNFYLGILRPLYPFQLTVGHIVTGDDMQTQVNSIGKLFLFNVFFTALCPSFVVLYELGTAINTVLATSYSGMASFHCLS